MRPISNSFIPNFEKDDISLILKLLFRPQLWQKGRFIEILEKTFARKFSFKYSFAFNSGRSALLAILKAIELKENQEVFLQSFTCNAAVNPILALKGKPIFVDLDQNLNLSPDDLRKKIESSKKPKAIIVQHTFGWPSQIEKIKKIAQEKKLFLIEDCAHSLGTKYQNQYLGKFGDISFFSFGRDKVISSVYGGIVATDSDRLAEKISSFQKKLSWPNNFWICQNLCQPIIFSISLPFYNFFNLGKILLYLARKLKLITPAVYQVEKKGKLAKVFPKKMPNALAVLALHQHKKLEKFNQHRKKIAEIYLKELKGKKGIKVIFQEKENNYQPIFMRFPILVRKRKEILKELKKRNIYLDDGWSETPIVPKGSDLKKFFYQENSCPRAEKIVKEIINLPTNIKISEKEAKKIGEMIIKFSSLD